MESGFLDKIIEYAKQGGVIYGGSAGAIILGNNVSQNRDPNTVNWPSNEGVNILHGFSVVPHYNSEPTGKMTKLKNIYLPENSGVYINNSSIVCLGDKVWVTVSGSCCKLTRGKMLKI
jgi:dipeptidase E